MLSVVMAILVCLAGTANAETAQPAVQTPADIEALVAQKEKLTDTIASIDETIEGINYVRTVLIKYKETKPEVSWAGQISGWIAVYDEAIAICQAQKKVLTDFLSRNDRVSDDEIQTALKSKNSADFQKRWKSVDEQMCQEEIMSELMNFAKQQQQKK